MQGSDGRTHVLYELDVRNESPLRLKPRRLAVSAPGGRSIATLGPAQTADALALPGNRRGNRVLADAQDGRLFVTVAFDSAADVPERLVNRATFAAAELDGGFTGKGVDVPVDGDFQPPVLGPPLEPGAGYVAADGCCHSERHIRAALTIGNSAFVAQRWAIDWEQLDSEGRFLEGDPKDPASYTVYGKTVLAVADGKVVHVADGLPEQVPGELPGKLASLADADGNSVVLDIGGGLYATYAHLQPGSLRVRQGESVQRGEPLGLVGNSGNSSAPHLHFQVTDGPSQLASSGLPYVIESFDTTGRIPSTEVFDRIENTARKAPVVPAPGDGPNRDRLPLDLRVVRFP